MQKRKDLFWHQQWLITAFVIVAVSVAVIMPQALTRTISISPDYNFHYNRIYDAMMQIKSGHFSYMQANYGFSHSGRIVNALYGPYCAYALGLLLLLTGSWFRFQIWSDLLLAIITASGMYLLARAAVVKRNFARTAAACSVFIGWTPIWAFNQSFMAFGQAFIPYALAAGMVMLRRKQLPGASWVCLGVSVGLLVQVHLLSAVLLVLAMVPFFIAAMFASKQRLRLFGQVCAAAILAILLSANYWAAFINVFSGNHIVKPVAFPDPSTYTAVISYAENTQTALGLFLSLGFVYVIVRAVVSKRVRSYERVLTLTGGVFLLLASKLLPWNALFKSFPALQTDLQLPMRFLVIAYPLLLVALMLNLQQLLTWSHLTASVAGRDTVRILQVTLVVLLAFPTLSALVDRADAWLQRPTITNQSQSLAVRMHTSSNFDSKAVDKAFNSGNLDALLHNYYNTVIDYLPTTTKQTAKQNASQYQQLAARYQREVAAPSRTGDYHYSNGADGSLIIRFRAHAKGLRKLPIQLYTDSRLKVNGKQLGNMAGKLDEICVPTVRIAAGENVAKLHYQEPFYLHAALDVTACTWFITIIAAVFMCCCYVVRKLQMSN